MNLKDSHLWLYLGNLYMREIVIIRLMIEAILLMISISFHKFILMLLVGFDMGTCIPTYNS